MDINTNWLDIRKLCDQGFSSSMHYSLATIDGDGLPHLAPIGSVMLGDVGKGIFLQKFTQKTPDNLDSNPNFCLMAVNSSLSFWLSSLFKGKFPTYPGVRLYGKASPARPATKEEIERWLKKVRAFSWTKGHSYLWESMAQARDLRFERVEPVKLGRMSSGLSL